MIAPIFCLVGAIVAGYYARQETGSDRTILTVLAVVLAIGFVGSLLRG